MANWITYLEHLRLYLKVELSKTVWEMLITVCYDFVALGRPKTSQNSIQSFAKYTQNEVNLILYVADEKNICRVHESVKPSEAAMCYDAGTLDASSITYIRH